MSNKEEELYTEKPSYIEGLMSLKAETMASIASPMPSVSLLNMPKTSELLGGIREHELTILCGSTGIGKTTFLSNVSSSLNEAGVNQLVIPVETGSLDYVRRMLSVVCQKQITIGCIPSAHEIAMIEKAYDSITAKSSLMFARHENRIPIEQLLADIRYCHQTYGTKVAIVDNLNFFLEVTSQANSIIEIDRVIHELVVFVKRWPIHVFMVMHPRKTEGKRLTDIYHIKGSSTAVQEAHNVLAFNPMPNCVVRDGLGNRDGRELFLMKCRAYGKYIGQSVIYDVIGDTLLKERGMLKVGDDSGIIAIKKDSGVSLDDISGYK